MRSGDWGKPTAPSPENGYLSAHVALLASSLRRWTGRNLVAPGLPGVEQARLIFEAPFALLSHDTSPDPVLNYANRTGLSVFQLSWDELIVMPSRLTAELPERRERERLLGEVSARGFIDDYAGVRVAKNGQRFWIEQATVWNVLDESGALHGQAATFSTWRAIH